MNTNEMARRSRVWNRQTESNGFSTMRFRERAKARGVRSVVTSVMATIALVHRFGGAEETRYPEVY